MTCTVFLFFFSSRRRHTRYWRDWSSDVCSEIVAECVLPCYTCEKATAWMKKHPWQRLQVWFSEKYRQFTAWIIYGRMYSLEDGKLDRSFRNIIYTHKRRLDRKSTRLNSSH